MTNDGAPNPHPFQRGMPFARGADPRRARRKPGTKNRATALAERLLTGDLEEVVRAVVSAAKGGDMRAARIILERVVPPRRGRPISLPLPEIKSAADIPAALAAVLAAVADGTASPEEGASVAAVIEGVRRGIELADLDARLRALEERARA